MLQRNKSVIDGLFNIFSSFKLSVINYTIRRQIEESARYYRITRNLTRNHNRNLWGFIGPHGMFCMFMIKRSPVAIVHITYGSRIPRYNRSVDYENIFVNFQLYYLLIKA